MPEQQGESYELQEVLSSDRVRELAEQVANTLRRLLVLLLIIFINFLVCSKECSAQSHIDYLNGLLATSDQSTKELISIMEKYKKTRNRKLLIDAKRSIFIREVAVSSLSKIISPYDMYYDKAMHCLKTIGDGALEDLLSIAELMVLEKMYDEAKKTCRGIITTYTGFMWRGYVKQAEFILEDIRSKTR
jgi:hypothetical protein